MVMVEMEVVLMTVAVTVMMVVVVAATATDDNAATGDPTHFRAFTLPHHKFSLPLFTH